jgi:D-glycero-alpha-D-manno-heptose-7-phosphate kinase
MGEARLLAVEERAAVRATSPVRIADVGGWTDTWFGSPGQVCHVAVGPGVAVEGRLVPDHPGVARIVAPDVGLDERIDPAAPGGAHPLLGHAVAASVDRLGLVVVPGMELVVRSAVPPGASLGTSAAVVVAVLGAVHALLGADLAPEDAAVLAHHVEVERVGRQSGVQDQWAAALGRAGLLAIGPYPEVRHRHLDLAASTIAALGERTVTVVFGPHDSSKVHAQVINDVVGCSGEAHERARRTLGRLSSLAGDAAAALEAGDVAAWAGVLVASTEAQADLHPDLVGPRHRAAIDAAHRLGAIGWKVNGAGGDGGSLTVVLGDGPGAASRADLVDAWWRLDPSWQILDLAPASSPGLQVERS